MMILSVTINSVLTSVSRIVAGVCLITESLYTLCRRCWLPGRRRGTECWWLCAAAARCGEMTPVRDLGQADRVIPSIPGYTRVYQVIPTQPQHFPINEYHKMQFILPRFCLLPPSLSRHQQLVMNQQPQQIHIQHLLNWGISLLYSASAACSAA